MKLTRRTLLSLSSSLLFVGCSAPGQDDDDGNESRAEGPLTLVQIERDAAGAPLGLVHLRLDPADGGENAMTIWLTDTQGVATSSPTTVAVTSLVDGQTLDPITLSADDAGLGADLDLAAEGWWQFDVSVERDAVLTTTRLYALLPDPNIHGTDAAPSPDESAVARDLFDRAIATMQSAPHLRWVESINTGDDTVVSIDFTHIAATATSPQAVEQFLRFSATFAQRAEGNPAPPPQTDSYHAITIGEEGWVLTADGTAATAPPIRYAPITEWGAIYAAAEHIAFGPAAEIDGIPVQVIWFYSPEFEGQAQAWFVWWIGTETGRVHRIGMIARAHYMVWTYSDFDADVTIDRPQAASASPVAHATGG